MYCIQNKTSHTWTGLYFVFQWINRFRMSKCIDGQIKRLQHIPHLTVTPIHNIFIAGVSLSSFNTPMGIPCSLISSYVVLKFCLSTSYFLAWILCRFDKIIITKVKLHVCKQIISRMCFFCRCFIINPI